MSNNRPNQLTDEDGIDGPFERRMARVPKVRKPRAPKTPTAPSYEVMFIRALAWEAAAECMAPLNVADTAELVNDVIQHLRLHTKVAYFPSQVAKALGLAAVGQ